ncbi:MAG: TVP38/TMEM64 family protein, partial [Caldimicrobium sp.]
MFDELIRYWGNRSLLREVVAEDPIKGAIIFILLQAIQVVIAPIPGEVTGFMAGFLFGGFLGFILSTIGIIIGSAIAFLIMRT